MMSPPVDIAIVAYVCSDVVVSTVSLFLHLRPLIKYHLMPPKRPNTSSREAGNGKKTRSIKDALLSNEEQVLKSLQLQHKGERLLLKSAAIYGSKSRIPKGEET